MDSCQSEDGRLELNNNDDDDDNNKNNNIDDDNNNKNNNNNAFDMYWTVHHCDN